VPVCRRDGDRPRAAIFLPGIGCRPVPARAKGQPALVMYFPEPSGGYRAGGMLVFCLVGGGDQVITGAIAGVAVVLLGWLAGENTRAGRVYAAQQAERAAEKAAAAEAERAEQVQRALADERAQIARELHDIVAHAMSVIAVRSGVARMVIDADPQQAREALAIIETTTRRSLHEMRLLVSMLRDPKDHHAELSPVPGLGDLDRLVAARPQPGSPSR
jgi:signal transduction histidine kinase